MELKDAYKSINESFIHAGVENKCKVNVKLVHSESLKQSETENKLAGLDGILVAPGFGNRGIEGKISAVKICKGKQHPIFRNLPWNAMCCY